MRKSEAFLGFVLDQLREVDDVSARAMFGGHGIYRGATMVGIVFKGRFYLKITRATKPRFEKAGMKPFRPTPTQTLKTYFEVPADVVESPSELARWVRPD
jgi:DNA transformation protein